MRWVAKCMIVAIVVAAALSVGGLKKRSPAPSDETVPSEPGGWRLWYEDEYFEDCDDPPTGVRTLPDCQDVHLHGPAFLVQSGCDQFANELQRTELGTEPVCLPIGTIPKTKPY